MLYYTFVGFARAFLHEQMPLSCYHELAKLDESWIVCLDATRVRPNDRPTVIIVLPLVSPACLLRALLGINHSYIERLVAAAAVI
jgi:hypothetical protein